MISFVKLDEFDIYIYIFCVVQFLLVVVAAKTERKTTFRPFGKKKKNSVSQPSAPSSNGSTEASEVSKKLTCH